VFEKKKEALGLREQFANSRVFGFLLFQQVSVGRRYALAHRQIFGFFPVFQSALRLARKGVFGSKWIFLGHD
jgi:hypothetical protein